MIAVARRYGHALDTEDWDTARSLLDPDVEVVRPSGRRYRGAERWIGMISAQGGFQSIDTAVEGRDYEQRNGRVVETQEIVHRWRETGEVAYTSRERTTMTIRDGRIARLESEVVHRAPS
ncbi:MAG: nuclear transport factor 2 family protein [Gaiellaceae bacterium]